MTPEEITEALGLDTYSLDVMRREWLDKWPAARDYHLNKDRQPLKIGDDE